jgi:hypothetical protein
MITQREPRPVTVNRRQFLRMASIGVAGTTLFGVTGCGNGAAGDPDEPVRIGALYPTSGALAAMAASMSTTATPSAYHEK